MLRELTNHVWQSTIFAVLVGLMTVAFRQNRAEVRYGLWLSASCKFLVPLSLLMTLGRRFEWAPITQKAGVQTAVQFTLLQISQPFPSGLAQPPATRATHDWASIAILGTWACGVAAIVLLRFRGWRRIRAAIRASTLLPIPAPIEIRSSPGLLEPGVVGFFRPILLLPAGIAERLEPPQFEAVLAHELCHVRRRDNMTSAIHMIVEAVFWFHPLVWWIGARLVEERERACDEAVLSLGSNPHDYAEGILRICESYVESPLSCVSGVTGSDLKRRIQAIMMERVGCELTFAKKIALAVAVMAAIAVPLAIGMIGVPRIQAQSQQPTPKFEAASIKSCSTFSRSTYLDLPPRTFNSGCTTVQRLVQQAYGLFAEGQMNPGSSLTVVGGQAWTTSDLYEIDARAKDPQGHSMMNGPMLRALLEARFALKIHRETRDLPVYVLTIAEGGPKLQPFQGNCTPRDFDKPPSVADCGASRLYGNEVQMKATTMAELCAAFSVLLDQRVIDKTGIGGRFNIDVDLPADDSGLLNRPRSLPATSDPTKPRTPPILFNTAETAMKKLGLNLEPTEGTGEFLVIDHVERPSEN
jgi:bla regulator protein BlaR1